MTIAGKTILIITSLLLIPLVTEAKEVTVYPFSFEIPDSWYVEGGDGSHHLFAKGGIGYMQPPLVMAESCVSNKKRNCVKKAINPSPYDPVTQKKAYEKICGSTTFIVIPRQNNITEKRLICPNVGYSLFISDGNVLSIAYMSKENAGIAKFLDSIALTLKN